MITIIPDKITVQFTRTEYDAVKKLLEWAQHVEWEVLRDAIGGYDASIIQNMYLDVEVADG